MASGVLVLAPDLKVTSAVGGVMVVPASCGCASRLISRSVERYKGGIRP